MTDTEIPTVVADEIASWRRIFASRTNADPRDLLRRACGDLWQVLEVDKTVHPETNGMIIPINGKIQSLHPRGGVIVFSESITTLRYNPS